MTWHSQWRYPFINCWLTTGTRTSKRISIWRRKRDPDQDRKLKVTDCTQFIHTHSTKERNLWAYTTPRNVGLPQASWTIRGMRRNRAIQYVWWRTNYNVHQLKEYCCHRHTEHISIVMDIEHESTWYSHDTLLWKIIEYTWLPCIDIPRYCIIL